MFISSIKHNINFPLPLSFGNLKEPPKTDGVQNLIAGIDSQIYLFENPQFYDFFEANKEAMTEKLKKL